MDLLVSIAKPLLSLFVIMWVSALCFFMTTSVVLGCIFTSFGGAQQQDKNKEKQKKGRLGYANTDIHQRWTRPFKRADWFSFNDVFYRYSLTTMAILWTQLTRPLQFLHYTVLFFPAQYGYVKAAYLTLMYPVMPFAILGLQVWEELSKIVLGSGGLDWCQNAPGKVFFIKPDNPASSFFWEVYLTQSMYVFGFLMLGTDSLAVAHTIKDVVLTKEFWRKHLENSGAYVAPELAHWDGKDKIKYSNDTQQKAKAIIKVNDSYLGLGDKIVKDISLGSKESKQWLENVFRTEYKDQRVLLLDFVKPKKEMGVHSVDIVTIKCPDGSYQVLSCLLWGECEGLTSHGTTAGFTIDVKTEQIAQKLY